MNHHHIGVLGAGQMGVGIAYVCACAQHQVTLYDSDMTQLEQASHIIRMNLEKSIQKGRIKEPLHDILHRIAFAKKLNEFEDCSMVLEAVQENEKAKKDVIETVSNFLKDETILASNTSSLSITRLASYSKDPSRFIGIHFMNPAPVMQLVEIIKGIATSDQTFQRTVDFISNLGKKYAVVEDYPAFVVNRLLIPMINEAVFTLQEGIGSIEDIDLSMRYGANHKMGPFELADLIGLDSCLAIMQTLYEGLAESKYRPCPLLVKYVDAGWLGRKTGKGFYDYSTSTPVPTK